MAAGAGAASGTSLESTLDKKFRNVSNTMDSIQGLSTWCIDNKKYHSLIVRHWMKCLRKANASHRLNLLYVANDVIQNCKRKNAIVYRTAFAEVLQDAFLLVNTEGDPKMIKSVERILSIWEDRDVYSGTLITELRNTLAKEESPPETPVEQKTPVESKADLRSKIVAEFVPQSLIEQLSKYKRSLEEVDIREKQLAAMRVDIFSSDALKKLKDKAGGKKFSRDFEEGSAQLQEFIRFYEQQSKTGPPLLEALSNADIFYEMQYKEVKIVANAYQTFANRVSHLKRKLDALKSSVPDLDDSPIPSPSADAPSPTGSESPFHGMELADPDPELDGSAMDDDTEPPAPSPLSSPGGSPKRTDALGENDNRQVEDMELSEEEMDGGGIIVEESTKPLRVPEEAAPVSAKMKPSVATEPVVPRAAVPSAAMGSVDIDKIGSILNSINPVKKNTGLVTESPPTAAPTTSCVKPKPAAPLALQDASSLINFLSKVDMNPADLLSALSKVQGQSSLKGITSHLSPDVGPDGPTASNNTPSPLSTSSSEGPSQSGSPSRDAPAPPSSDSAVQQSSGAPAAPETSNKASALVQALHRDMDLATETEQSFSSVSLESKIHNFLRGNQVFSAFDLSFSTNPAPEAEHFSPAAVADNQDGTPVRDEGGGTPTQDEIMDKPAVVPFAASINPLAAGEAVKAASVLFENSKQQIPNNPLQTHSQPSVAQNGQVFHSFPYGKQDSSEAGITAPAAHYPAQTGGPGPGLGAPGGAGGTQTIEGFKGGNERSWFGDGYPEGGAQQLGGYNVLVSGGVRENNTSGLYPYQTEQTQKPQELASNQGPTAAPSFFKNALPPVPKLPPPPTAFDFPPPPSGMMSLPEQEPIPSSNAAGVFGSSRGSAISGMVVHDHQHTSSLRPDDSFRDPHRPHPNDLHYHDEPRERDAHFCHDDPYYPPNDAYFRPGSPPHPYARPRGHLSPPLSPSGDHFFPRDFQQHSPPPRPMNFTPRRPPREIRHPGLRPPLRPPHPALHPPIRGPPRPPFPRFQGPDPRLRCKRPGFRGRGPMFPPKRPFLPPRY
ncbi:regulation of nuclear pre-mRNA domain-containing protein 2a [Kryptolebias marmoratus]|uniref:Regulation of nuclear pre-mRNA domain-containing protein 2 n=1 Tax=Kryptolebias marmoratus TaxID=37003 RepID=A0A3Q3AHA2_KRYMA|nr:regulation of nuclear pre-mRNA domain-containing protein 2a [Kryptolebias marmoratus]